MLCISFFSVTFLTYLSSGKEFSIVMKDSPIRLESMILEISITLLAMPFIKIFRSRINATNKEYIYLTLPSIIYIIIIITIMKVMLNVEFTSSSIKFSLVLISITLMIISIYSFFVSDRNIKLIDRLIEQKVKMSKDYYSNLENHEINTSNEFNTNNQMLNLVLLDKKHVCNLKDIVLSVDIEFSPCSFMNNSDVSNIFSNLIDNAMEACETLKAKKCRFGSRNGGQ